jgi:hypothetical protein
MSRYVYCHDLQTARTPEAGVSGAHLITEKQSTRVVRGITLGKIPVGQIPHILGMRKPNRPCAVMNAMEWATLPVNTQTDLKELRIPLLHPEKGTRRNVQIIRAPQAKISLKETRGKSTVRETPRRGSRQLFRPQHLRQGCQNASSFSTLRR